MNVGLYGGTFDPPHLGHLVAAQDACAALSLDRVLFIPAALPPHKQNRPVTKAETRVEMLRAAIADNEQFEICTLELERDGPSYTADTLRELTKQMPGTHFFLLLGVDQVRDFATWREPEAVAKMATLAMLTRGEIQQAVPDSVAGHVVQVTRLDISSTLIRERAARGEPIRYLVADGVERIIRREGLYRPVVG